MINPEPSVCQTRRVGAIDPRCKEQLYLDEMVLYWCQPYAASPSESAAPRLLAATVGSGVCARRAWRLVDALSLVCDAIVDLRSPASPWCSCQGELSQAEAGSFPACLRAASL